MDPNTFLDMFMSNNGNNQTGFSNPEYDALLTAAAAETDTTKRLAILAEAERLLMIEQPIIPIYTYVSRNLVRPSVRGFYNNVQDSHPLSSLWIDPDPKGPNEFMRGAPR
jgi:oligopeptide transport system substrate-binding protein